MNIYPVGDYYAWYCGWCDTKNLTLWMKIEEGEVTCGACHLRHNINDLLDDNDEVELASAV